MGGKPPLTARNGSEPYSGERDPSEREALPTPYSRRDGGRPAAQSPRAHAVERRERHCRKQAEIFKLALGGIGVNQNKKNQKGAAMGGHNRAEARARSSGEIAGRALGGKPPLTARNGSEPYCGERSLSEREALPTPYSRRDGGRPAAQSPRAHAVECRECHSRKTSD